MAEVIKRKRGAPGGNRNAVNHRAKLIRFVRSGIGRQFYKTNEAKTPETIEIFTKRIVAES